VPGSYADFVESRLPSASLPKGPITDEKGEVLAQHEGIHRYTVGQRKGLGLASLEPKYVLAVHPDGRVVTGDNQSLFKRSFEIRDATWVDEIPQKPTPVLAQIRSRFSPSPAVIERLGEDRVRVTFAEKQRAITPGQAAVFYRGEEMLGGGWIDRVDS